MPATVVDGFEPVPSDNACGFKGVCRNGGKFKVQVWEDGKLRHLGSFDTAEEAALARACYIRDLDMPEFRLTSDERAARSSGAPCRV